ncbi:aldose epimerase family protein [Planctobacterium marinum]|uniref:Aldose 1-epimerase n=1 Tax=Planctobacterium marinum TaxID=1631968 RepID=A0AA48I624_9ALTE|nr:aldose 1-epimerase [Planctobacterium marinum]
MLNTWQISNQNGNQATILNYGARLIDWSAEVTNGRNIIVGYDHVEDYLQDGACMGAIAGPYANRIAGAQVNIDGKTINLGANEGVNHLHGAQDGLQLVYWQLEARTENAITLVHQHLGSSDVGYPGNIIFKVTYTVTEQDELIIDIKAQSERIVPIGPTGHAYINLGEHSKNINDHTLQLNAESYTPVDEQNIPNGSIEPMPEEYDFQSAKAVTASLDNNFVVKHGQNSVPVATLVSPDGKLTLEVCSDYPGIQVYTADHMSTPFVSRNAICLEPQYFPDAPNKTNFPFEFTEPGKPFHKFIKYQLKNTEL